MSKPIRIEPVRLPDGKFITPNPPSGGSWTITADGALQPRDRNTAERAGLAWAETVVTVAAPTATSIPAPVAPAVVPAADK